MLTDRMRTCGLRINAEKRYGHKCAIPPQTQNRIAKLKSCMVLVCIPLIEVDI
jgi:hypothetical protein